MSDDREIAGMEIDLEIADIGEILLAHRVVVPDADALVTALWQWKETRAAAAWDEGFAEGQECGAYGTPQPDNPYRALGEQQ